MKFNKPAISISEQIELLKSRGMTVDDEERAAHYLSFISYYRLRPYWLPFEVPAAREGDHRLRQGTKFDEVLELYIFDRLLRCEVISAVERVEVAVRAQWAYHMAMTFGPHGYLNRDCYTCGRRHGEVLERLGGEFRRSQDAFANHYREKYSDPEMPPVWMVAELASFGLLSRILSNMPRRNLKDIARHFALDAKNLTSFTHHISHVRNICAHHGRLWNRRFTVKMKVPRNLGELSDSMRKADAGLLHNTLVMLGYLLSVIEPGSKWRGRIIALAKDYPDASLASMGFPDDWENLRAWK